MCIVLTNFRVKLKSKWKLYQSKDTKKYFKKRREEKSFIRLEILKLQGRTKKKMEALEEQKKARNIPVI